MRIEDLKVGNEYITIDDMILCGYDSDNGTTFPVGIVFVYDGTAYDYIYTFHTYNGIKIKIEDEHLIENNLEEVK